MTKSIIVHKLPWCNALIILIAIIKSRCMRYLFLVMLILIAVAGCKKTVTSRIWL
jgi:hypothetical protein